MFDEPGTTLTSRDRLARIAVRTFAAQINGRFWPGFPKASRLVCLSCAQPPQQHLVTNQTGSRYGLTFQFHPQ